MRGSIAVLLSSFVTSAVLAVPHEKRAISQSLYDTLFLYWKYSASAYATTCAHPNNNTLVAEFNNAGTDTQGFVARDDTRREVIVAFRGTGSRQDFTTDFDFELTDYTTSGVTPPSGTQVHEGFLGAWNSVSSTVLSTVRSQLASNSGYSIVVTGHSLGGGVASVAAPSFKSNFAGSAVRLYTYGQPRTGNPTYASYIDSLFGQDAYRVVHRVDSVPTFVPPGLGFKHHGNEYWNSADPVSPSSLKACSGDEDPTCSISIPNTAFLNQDHLVYFNTFFTTTYC